MPKNNSKSKGKKTESAAAGQAKDQFLIVGIGASAGGVAALKEFFSNVKRDSGIAYVVILHLSPLFESKLAEVLQTVSPIPVTQVTKKERVEPDHVYVVPPNKSLSMVDGHIVLKPLGGISERRAPVDIFFRTLADSHGPNAVCVILSGTGANGSMGLKRIKEAGGAAFVQSPREAEYVDMPRNSIATELVDAILPVKEIPRRIVAYRDRLGKISIPVEPGERDDDQQKALRNIFNQLKVRTGNDFSNYKRPTVLRRLERRIVARGLTDLASYAKFLVEEPEETQALLKDLLISVTTFFRDKQAFDHLENNVVPQILANRTPLDQVRIWVAGCATGEEAYSLAMIFAEKTAKMRDAPPVQIFATDIDERAVATARDGIYTLNDTVDIPPERLHKFFTPEGDLYRIRRDLREMVLFAHHNILKDPPFARLDLACCRNMMIYFNGEAQERAMETLHFALRPGGYLFLGPAESIDGSGDLFVSVRREHHIYQARRMSSRVALPMPDTRTLTIGTAGTSAADVLPKDSEKARALRRMSFADLHQQLLEQYAPPSVVVNEQYDIVHVSDSAGKYLQVAGGEATMNLLKVIKPDLRIELRTALFEAVQKRLPVTSTGLSVKANGHVETVDLHIRPVFAPQDTARGFVLVLFEPSTRKPRKQDRDDSSVPVAQKLEEELLHSKENLRSTIAQFELQTEELRASNEELQAMNEELRSSSEELETSKEELQSVNEELLTVNQELKVKIDELSQSNADFLNLINSSDAVTVFLDRDLRVKLFSPAARTIFKLIAGDIGRSLFDLQTNLADAHLVEDAKSVLETLRPVRREVHAVNGDTYLMSITAYRSSDDRISGVIFTFVDITGRLKTESQLRESQERLRLLIASAVDFAIFALSPDGRVEFWNKGAEKVFGWSEEEIIGKSGEIMFTREDRVAGVPEEEMKTAAKKGRAEEERWHQRKDGTRFYASGVMTRLNSQEGKLIGFAKIARDMTGQIRGEHAEKRNLVLTRLVESQEEERQRIARDLHDHLGQQLTALRLTLEGLKANYSGEPAMMKAIDDTQKQAQQIDNDVSFLAWELRPTALDNLGLRNALGNYVVEWSKNYHIEAEFHTVRVRKTRLVPEIEINLYRIAQEALNNVLKHAKATKVEVILEFSKNDVILVVEDNGAGFDAKGSSRSNRKGKGLGLVGMGERAGLLGGTVAIESRRGKGTTVIARVPARLVEKEKR